MHLIAKNQSIKKQFVRTNDELCFDWQRLNVYILKSSTHFTRLLAGNTKITETAICTKGGRQNFFAKSTRKKNEHTYKFPIVCKKVHRAKYTRGLFTDHSSSARFAIGRVDNAIFYQQFLVHRLSPQSKNMAIWGLSCHFSIDACDTGRSNGGWSYAQMKECFVVVIFFDSFRDSYN